MFYVIINESRNGATENNNSRRDFMSNQGINVFSVLDTKSTTPEKMTALNILLWEKLATRMLGLPNAD
jgi:hypothetical protein